MLSTTPFTTPTSPVGCAPCRQQDTFQIQLARLAVFCNDARTRTFLAVAAEEAGSRGSNTSNGSSSSEGELAAGCIAGEDSGAPAHAAVCPSGKGGGSSGSSDGTSSGELEGSGGDASTAAANGVVGSTAARHPQRPNYCRQLVQMCHAVSGVFAAHGLPRFYADPQPHASSECHYVGTPVAGRRRSVAGSRCALLQLERAAGLLTAVSLLCIEVFHPQ